ncbi:MAG: 50S ribosomal protein L29 [Candidatus Margulisiibacteriota bacterium]
MSTALLDSKQLRELSAGELHKKLDETRRELVGLRIQRANQQLKNLLKIRELRRMVARILTIVREKGDK